MGGAAKNRANRRRKRHTAGNGSSSGETSSSGKATRSARSDGRSQGGRSTTSRRTRYDGPTSRSGSPVPGGSGSRPGSRSGSPRPGTPPTGGSSGGRDPATARPAVVSSTALDLPAAAYSVLRGQDSTARAPRPQPSKAGQSIRIALNTFDTEISTDKKDKSVYQYDVLIGNGVEKRG